MGGLSPGVRYAWRGRWRAELALATRVLLAEAGWMELAPSVPWLAGGSPSSRVQGSCWRGGGGE